MSKNRLVIIVKHNGDFTQDNYYVCEKSELETVLRVARQEMYVNTIEIKKEKDFIKGGIEMKGLEALDILWNIANSKVLDLEKELKSTIEKELKAKEQLENKLGVDLSILFTALEKGFYTKFGNEIKFRKNDNEHTIMLRNLGYDIELVVETAKNERNTKIKGFLEISTKNYGKTWALTKEELKEGLKNE